MPIRKKSGNLSYAPRIFRTLVGAGSYPFAEMQSVYSAVSVNRVHVNMNTIPIDIK